MTYKEPARRLCFLLLLSWICALPAMAQEEAIPAPKFAIKSFEVTGDSILGAELVQRLVTPFTGSNKDFGDVQRALEALEAEYRSRGYGVIQVALPEQDITRGVVRFTIKSARSPSRATSISARRTCAARCRR